MTLHMSTPGRRELGLFEGTVLHAYKDATGTLTIGTGHTAAAGAPIPVEGMQISAVEADTILSDDLAHNYEPALARHVKVDLKQCEFDAVLSFVYNIGEGNFAGSTLLTKLNAGDKGGAADAFSSWTRSHGRVLPGLVTRRQTERTIFLTGTYPGVAPAEADTGRAIKDAVSLGAGMTGDAVKTLQGNLVALGFDPGAVDGAFGPKTVAAVKAFQRAKGLSDDGIAGLKTGIAIDTAMAAKAPAPPVVLPSVITPAPKPQPGLMARLKAWWSGSSS